MQIEIKPLVWKTHCRETGGCSAQAFCGEYILETDEPGGEFGMWVPGQGEGSETDFYFSSLEATQAAANAHHAAHVRSQVAGVRLSDVEARKIADVVLAEVGRKGSGWSAHAAQAAIATMQVDADPAPGNGDDDGE